jgi:hypothetical protein
MLKRRLMPAPHIKIWFVLRAEMSLTVRIPNANTGTCNK